MASLNDMVLQLSSTNDTKKKLTIGQDIIDYLGQPENSVECDDLGGFIDTLVPFMQSSNFKVFMFIIKFVLFSILLIQIATLSSIVTNIFLGFSKWT